jgi:hypothetical protein
MVFGVYADPRLRIGRKCLSGSHNLNRCARERSLAEFVVITLLRRFDQIRTIDRLKSFV